VLSVTTLPRVSICTLHHTFDFSSAQGQVSSDGCKAGEKSGCLIAGAWTPPTAGTRLASVRGGIAVARGALAVLAPLQHKMSQCRAERSNRVGSAGQNVRVHQPLEHEQSNGMAHAHLHMASRIGTFGHR